MTAPPVPKLLATAQSHARQGRHAAAARACEELLQEEPELVEGWLVLAEAHRDLGHKGAAARAYGEAAFRYHRRGDSLKALQVHEAAESSLPEHPEIYRCRARLLLEAGKPEESQPMVVKALQALQDQGGRLAGLRLVRDLLEGLSAPGLAWVQLAERLSSLGHVQEAADAFEVAVTGLEEGGFEPAFRQVARRLLEHDSTRSAVARRLANSHRDAGEYGNALRALRLACRASPEDMQLLDLVVDCLLQVGREESAVVVLKAQDVPGSADFVKEMIEVTSP